MKDVILSIAYIIIGLIVIIFTIYGEYCLLDPIFGNEYGEWVFIIMIGTFYFLASLTGRIIEHLLPNLGKTKIRKNISDNSQK